MYVECAKCCWCLWFRSQEEGFLKWHRCNQPTKVLCVCTHAHLRTLSCPLALIHVFMCASYSNIAWSWARRASHSPWQEASGSLQHFFSPEFSQKAELPPGTEELSCSLQMSPEMALSFSTASSSHMRLYFWKMATGDTRIFFLGAYSTIC